MDADIDTLTVGDTRLQTAARDQSRRSLLQIDLAMRTSAATEPVVLAAYSFDGAAAALAGGADRAGRSDVGGCIPTSIRRRSTPKAGDAEPDDPTCGRAAPRLYRRLERPRR